VTYTTNKREFKMKHKKIVWQSWNAIEEGIIARNNSFLEDILNQDQSLMYDQDEIDSTEFTGHAMPLAVQTPIGVFPQDSFFLPSNRWDCWIGSTNFDITFNLQDEIKEVAGVERLKTIGRYTFFIGVAKLFDIRDVRRDIEKVACIYTESEILSDVNIKMAVEEVKNQISDKPYWSIFVGVDGDIDYCISDEMDIVYLRDVNKLNKKKESSGGMIIRSENG
jgi:hypothetical protein